MSDRQRTRVIVIVHSHIQREGKGVIDCSRDVVELSTSKTIKGTGGFTFTLVPRRNYLNLLFPDDVVNIYMDPGDGKSGFVRLMMGYIDRVNRTETVTDQGAMQTSFQIVGTDFGKAIDKTEIYFNPQLAGREEFTDTDFGLSLLGGGHALRTRGITAHGTPAQFIENLLQLLLGFGAQWVLPKSYPTSNFLDKSRSARRQRVKNSIPEEVKNNLRSAFNVDIEDIGLAKDVEKTLFENLFGTGGVGPLDQKQAAISNILTGLSEFKAFQTVLRETSEKSPASIHDLISVDFIEALTVDGNISSSSVWTGSNNTLASILYGWSNEIVNELCFDLRPVATDANDQCFGTKYSTEADELKINTNGTQDMPSSVHAVKYVPAVIFRENPYSVVEGLDLNDFYVLGTNVGFQAFGPVFSIQPNIEGRHLYNYENAGIAALTPEKCVYAAGKSPLKHLDVITIVNQDVTGSQLGRSDADTFNFFELYATAPKPEMWKFILREILPVITPVSINRHGLRLRSNNTKFANYSRDQLCNETRSSGVDNAAIRRNIIRWTLLMDHWYQHNIEYLSGQISMRARPDIRVGYRLDWKDRHESYYVESVQHQWAYPGAARTTVGVSRGQRNDPYPAYIPPVLSKTGGLPAGAFNLAEAGLQGPENANEVRARQAATAAKAGGGDRSEKGRLADYFIVRDTRATSFAVNGEASFSNENDIDKQENIPGFAIAVGETPSFDQRTKDAVDNLGKALKGTFK